MGAIASLFNGPPPPPQGYDMKKGNAAYDQAQQAMGQQQALISALNAQNGIGNQSNVFNQLNDVAHGQGPNPAQAMLNQATGANVANQAAMAAGQRGASGNVGLMARQAAQAGSNAQQQAAGQGATMQANQSLGALGQMGGIANQQASQQIGAVGNLNQMAQNEQGQVMNSVNNQNNINAGIAQQQAQAGSNLLGGIVSGVGSLAAKGAGFHDGGMAENPKLAKVPESHRFAGAADRRAKYPAHLRDVAHLYHGGMPEEAGTSDFTDGGSVPGEPVVQHDSVKNDVVPAMLTPKEIVLPISVTQSDNAPEEAARFVARELQKHNGGGKKDEKEFKEALKRAIAGRKSA